MTNGEIIAGLLFTGGVTLMVAAGSGVFKSSRYDGKQGGEMNSLERRQFELYMGYPLTPTRWERFKAKLAKPFCGRRRS